MTILFTNNKKYIGGHNMGEKKLRSDAWTTEMDNLLAETVLNELRNGKTKRSAFEVVAEKLSRTDSAVAYRWNTVVSKQYGLAAKTAKKNGDLLKKKQKSKESSKVSSINDVKKVKASKKQISANTEKSTMESSPTMSKSKSSNSFISSIMKHIEEHNQLLTRVEKLENELKIRDEELNKKSAEIDQLKASLQDTDKVESLLAANQSLKDKVAHLESELDRARPIIQAIKSFESSSYNKREELSSDDSQNIAM